MLAKPILGGRLESPLSNSVQSRESCYKLKASKLGQVREGQSSPNQALVWFVLSNFVPLVPSLVTAHQSSKGPDLGKVK